jgi:hypothetical protein
VSRLSGGLWGRFATAASVTLAVAFLASCATGPEYRPRAPGERIGYTDLQLSPTRYRVTFSGSSASKREDVENALLRRAAEVTLAAGYTHFVFDARDTEARTYYRETFSSFDPIYGYPYFGPGRAFYWPYYAPYSAFGPYGYGYGFGGYGFGGGLRPVTSYSAYSEIVMLNTEQTSGNPDALDAHFLLQRLTPPAPPPTAGAASGPARG